jgi:Type II secretion system (T2SS), protein E, N-terminal domain
VPILARILKDRGIVTERQLEEAIRHQVLYGGRLGTSLHELGFITEERLQESLARACGQAGLTVDLRELDPAAVKLLPRALAVKHRVCPLKVKGRTLFLLMINPGDHSAVAKVSYALGYIVRPLVVHEFRMVQLLRDHYGVDERWRFTDTQRAGEPPRLPPLDPEAALQRIDHAESRDEVVEAVLALCHRTFRRVIFFIVREPWVVGWTGAGEGMDRAVAGSLRVPLDAPSVFQSVVRDRSVFVGRFGPEEENQRFLSQVGKKQTTNAALLPVVVRGRVVNLVYGDNGPTGNVKADLGDLLVRLQHVPRAYLRIIRRRIAETRRETGSPGGEAAGPGDNDATEGMEE